MSVYLQKVLFSFYAESIVQVDFDYLRYYIIFYRNNILLSSLSNLLVSCSPT